MGFVVGIDDVFKHLVLQEGAGHFWYMPVIIKFCLVVPISELSGGIVAGIVEFVFGGEFQYAEELEFLDENLHILRSTLY